MIQSLSYILLAEKQKQMRKMPLQEKEVEFYLALALFVLALPIDCSDS